MLRKAVGRVLRGCDARCWSKSFSDPAVDQKRITHIKRDNEIPKAHQDLHQKGPIGVPTFLYIRYVEVG